jgi:Na(+)-translocating NADH:ubiquinone oxidoreductase A subunit
MRIHGGYLPRIAGRPLSIVEELPLPRKLEVELHRGGLSYKPTIRDGQRVEFGEVIAEASSSGGVLGLPSPAAGKAFLSDKRLILEEPRAETAPLKKFQAERISREETVTALARAGIWPLFWSSATRGVPALGSQEKPQAIVLNMVLTEPFKARGKVILRRSWSRIIEGLKFLPRLLQDYGTLQVVLTAVRDPVARMIYADLAGFAWVHFRPIPLRYPAENPRVLEQSLRRSEPKLRKDGTIWIIDVQAAEAVGGCLAEGLPLHQRVVVTGGPASVKPRHLAVRIGTPLGAFAPESQGPEVRTLRGGLLKGELIDPAQTAVQYDDDAYFLFPETSKGQFLGFLRPGFDRTSYMPCFASVLTGSGDRYISTALRGERRPCIACGLCEQVCPVQIMPQVLHRYLYREAYDETERAGLDRCVDCNLCTFVCPSKIELQKQFSEARQRLLEERAGASETPMETSAAQELTK